MADESLDITLNNNNTLNGAFGLTSTNNATSSETVEIKPLSQSLEIKPLSQTATQTTNETMELKPVKVDSSNRQEVVYDPIRTDSSSTVDVKPLAMDVCVRSGPAPLPPTHICEPYRHHIGLTLLGVEVIGLAWSGESQTIVDDRPRRPVVSWGAVMPAPPRVEVDLPTHRHRHRRHHHPPGLEVRPAHDRGGLRIRLDG